MTFPVSSGIMLPNVAYRARHDEMAGPDDDAEKWLVRLAKKWLPCPKEHD